MFVPTSRTGQLKFLVELAGLAPSSHNTQPWSFGIDKNSISVWADLSRRLPIGDPHDRELYASVGAAVQNILSGARAMGIQVTYELFPLTQSPDLVARVDLTFNRRGIPSKSSRILSAIQTRRTNRTPYDPSRFLSAKARRQITNLASDLGGQLVLITERPSIIQMAKMVERGMLKFLSNPRFREELSGWIRHDWSKKGDGLPGYSLGMPGIVSIIAPILIKSPSPIKAVAASERKVVESCSTLGVITIPADNKIWWVKTGMIFEHIALTLETQGIATAILTSIVESKAERQKLQSMVKGIPGLFFRLGYSTGPGISVPRRTHVTQ